MPKDKFDNRAMNCVSLIFAPFTIATTDFHIVPLNATTKIDRYQNIR